MACLFISTIPRPGDNLTTLLRKWLQAVDAPAGCLDDGEWMLLSRLVSFYGGTPRPGDTIADLWRKIRVALGSTNCFCGDSAWDSARRILDILNPGSFRVGDSIYNILFKIVQFVSEEEPINECCLEFIVGGPFGLIDSPECLELIDCV